MSAMISECKSLIGGSKVNNIINLPVLLRKHITGTMTDIKQHVGQQIRKARKAKGLTMKDLADKVGVSESTFSRYESGKQAVSFEQVAKIADELGLNLKVTIE